MSVSIKNWTCSLFVLAAAVCLMTPTHLHAQDETTPPKQEFRGAWIATVTNIDWPRNRGGSLQQKNRLSDMLDELKAHGVNAVFFQIRTEADALYDSDLEPWSYWLTGEQGAAPDPYYDPLKFAIREAHERGMELHAWFNPYRADRGSDYPKADSHVTNTNPEWILSFDDGNLKILNPGLPQVRDYVTRVVMDVVNRYNVDGVHFDDYFYPYPPNHMEAFGNNDKDQEAFSEYTRGFSDVEAWRRDNINLLVAQVYDSIQAEKPEVAFGISPFGIWKNGVPRGITGLNAFSTIYADAVAWVDSQHVDYLTPQLYWGYGGGQDYATLAPWWAEQTSRNNRHLYPGLALYKDFSPNGVPRQIRLNRTSEDIMGHVLFSARYITRFDNGGVADSIKRLNRIPALTPTMPWLDTTAPGTPQNLTFTWGGERNEYVQMTWQGPEEAPGTDSTQFYAVYRVNSADQPDPAAAMQDARNLLAVTGDTTYSDRPTLSDSSFYYFVTSVSNNSVESSASNMFSVEARGVGIDDPATPSTPSAITLKGNFPNPFASSTEIAFSLGAPSDIRLTVYDVLGRQIRVLKDGRMSAGDHEVVFRGHKLPAGVYFYRLAAGERVSTGKMVLAK